MTTPQVVTPDNTPTFNIQRIYMKGASLEMPHAPAIFLEQGEINVEFNLAPNVDKLAADIYEVNLRGTITAKLADKVFFLLEVDQAGIFEARNIPENELSAVLEINGPAILTPYLRVQISDILSRASVPPFLLPEINWAGAFMEKQKNIGNSAAPSTPLVH